MTNASIVVVIVSYQSAIFTIDCLYSIDVEKNAHQLSLNAIVVDNASGDSPEIADAVQKNNWGNWVTVLTAPKNGGFAYGNNFAFEYALTHFKVDYFHLLNPDTVVRDQAILQLASFLDTNHEAGIVGSRFENGDGSIWPIAFRFPSLISELEAGLKLGVVSSLLKKWVVAVDMQPIAQPIDWIAGASMMIRRDVVENLCGFDEGYFLYFEETDFCLRAKRSGYATWYVPSSMVMHIAGQSTKVTERNASLKRLPSYWFASRRRYFMVNHGVFYAILADFIALFANSLGLIKCFVLNKKRAIPPFYLIDLIKKSSLLNTRVALFYSCLMNLK